MIRINSDSTPYELWKGRSANVNHFSLFGSKCYIKREDKKIGKFDSWVDEGIFVGYSWKHKAYNSYNLRLKKILEIINVKFDETYLLKTKKEDINSNIFKEQEKEELKQEEEEDEEEKQEEKHHES